MFRKITLAVATIAALSPVIAGASSVEKASMNACAKAFAASVAAPGTTAPDYKLAYLGSMPADVFANFLPLEYSFDLEIRDAKTGLATARAHCSTNDHGTVTALQTLPVRETVQTKTLHLISQN